MKASSPPTWLAEIREYWSEMTARLADQAGQPTEVAPETGVPALPERPALLPEPPQSESNSPYVLSEKAD